MAAVHDVTDMQSHRSARLVEVARCDSAHLAGVAVALQHLSPHPPRDVPTERIPLRWRLNEPILARLQVHRVEVGLDRPALLVAQFPQTAAVLHLVARRVANLFGGDDFPTWASKNARIPRLPVSISI